MQLPCCFSMNSNLLFSKLVYEVSSNEQENFSWKSFCRVRKFDSSAFPSLYNLHWDRIYAHIQLIFPQRFYLVVRAETINDLNLMNQWQALPTQEVFQNLARTVWLVLSLRRRSAKIKIFLLLFIYILKGQFKTNVKARRLLC